MNLTERDERRVKTLLYLARNHFPGGKYGMVASWVKGKRMIVGYNNSDRPAATAVNGYPDICGIHAELDIYLTAKANGTEIRGGTIYIVGRKKSNDKIMLTTRPCVYCRTILSSTKVRYVVFFDDGKLRKVSAEELWDQT